MWNWKVILFELGRSESDKFFCLNAKKIWDWRVLFFELRKSETGRLLFLNSENLKLINSFALTRKYESDNFFCLNSEYTIRRVLLFELGKSKGAKSFCFPWQLSLNLENVSTNLSLRCYAWRLHYITTWLYVYLHQLVYLILKQG
jgi:hypothetical protein